MNERIVRLRAHQKNVERYQSLLGTKLDDLEVQFLEKRLSEERLAIANWMRASNLTVPTMPTLRPKLRKVPRRSFSMAMAFDSNSLRWVSSIRSF